MLHLPHSLCLCLALLYPQDDSIKSEMEKLQGDWRIVSGSMPDEFMRKTLLSFQEDKLFFIVDEHRTELRYKLKPQRKPSEIDMLKGERKLVGIYELRGDELRLCYEVEGRAPRPQKFEVVTGKEILLILKRRK